MRSADPTAIGRVAPVPGPPRISVPGCRILEFPVVKDDRGNLTVVEGGQDIPFEISRVFYLDVVPADATRAGHANRRTDQVLVALSGSFAVTLDDGDRRQIVSLSGSSHGLLIPRLVWREIGGFSSGAVCLVFASLPYDAADYYRDYAEYVRALRTP